MTNNIQSNKELIQAVSNAIKESGIKKTALAQKIGLSRQGLDNLLNKKSFSMDDANRILQVLNYKVVADLKIKNEINIISKTQ